MSRLARLRDVFLPNVDPQRAYFCTYGLDPKFFEGELLPALFPNSLALDREAGAASAYVNAADTALQRHDVGVFYDHLTGDGQELQYGAWAVNVRPRAFHAKLMLLDYGGVVRAVISSANLTAAAWTRNLELFLVEDLRRGGPHPWAAGLSAFVNRLVDQIPEQHTQHRQALGSILDGIAQDKGSDRVTSSWEEPLLDALFHGISTPKSLDVVTPFFEGVDGEGVFDNVERRAPGWAADSTSRRTRTTVGHRSRVRRKNLRRCSRAVAGRCTECDRHGTATRRARRPEGSTASCSSSSTARGHAR